MTAEFQVAIERERGQITKPQYTVDRSGTELRLVGQENGDRHRLQVLGQLLRLEMKPLQSLKFFFP